jgi:hypothetical protein
VSNVLNEEKKQQVIALARLGWSMRRIQCETHIRRETAAAYLKAAGIAIRPPGGWCHRAAAKPAIEVTTDFGGGSAGGTAVPAEPLTGRSPMHAFRGAAYPGTNQFTSSRMHRQSLTECATASRPFLSVNGSVPVVISSCVEVSSD